jgi:O-antigen/teichoic acid export membrane protein
MHCEEAPCADGNRRPDAVIVEDCPRTHFGRCPVDVVSEECRPVTLRMPRTSRRALSAIAASSGTSMVSAFVAFVVNILMARHLGPGARGEVAWVLQGAYVLAPLLALGVDRQALREANPTSAISQRHVWTLSFLGVALAVAVWSIPWAVCVATAALLASLSIERGTGMATGSLHRYVAAMIGMQAWILGASIVLYVTHVDDPTWWMAVYAAPAPVLLLLTFRSTPSSRVHHGWRARLFGTVDVKSVSYMLGGLGMLLASRSERLILPILGSTKELGLYVTIATASELLVWAAWGLGESRVIGFMSGTLTRTSLAKVVTRDLAFFLVLTAPLAVGIYFLLIPLLGPGFAEADVLVIPLCLASASWATYLQLSAVWLARGTVRQSIRLDIGAAILTIICVTALIPTYGALGAAIGCLVAYTAMLPIAVVLMPRVEAHEVADV